MQITFKGHVLISKKKNEQKNYLNEMRILSEFFKSVTNQLTNDFSERKNLIFFFFLSFLPLSFSCFLSPSFSFLQLSATQFLSSSFFFNSLFFFRLFLFPFFVIFFLVPFFLLQGEEREREKIRRKRERENERGKKFLILKSNVIQFFTFTHLGEDSI